MSLREGRRVGGYSRCITSGQETRDDLRGIWAEFLEIIVIKNRARELHLQETPTFSEQGIPSPGCGQTLRGTGPTRGRNLLLLKKFFLFEMEEESLRSLEVTYVIYMTYIT